MYQDLGYVKTLIFQKLIVLAFPVLKHIRVFVHFNLVALKKAKTIYCTQKGQNSIEFWLF